MLPSVLQQKVCEVSTRLQNLFASCAGCRANVYELQPQAKAMRLVQRCVPVQQLPLPQHPHPLLKLHRRRPCGIAVLLRMGRGLHNRSTCARPAPCCCVADAGAGAPLLAVAGEKAAIRIIHLGRMKSVSCLQVKSHMCAVSHYDLLHAPASLCRVVLLQGHGRSINDLRFLPSDPNMLLSCSSDESCRLWNVVTLQLAVIFGGWHGHRSAVLSLDVHVLGGMFASCGMDNRCRSRRNIYCILALKLRGCARLLSLLTPCLQHPRVVSD